MKSELSVYEAEEGLIPVIRASATGIENGVKYSDVVLKRLAGLNPASRCFPYATCGWVMDGFDGDDRELIEIT